jgi:hypothetical protein
MSSAPAPLSAKTRGLHLLALSAFGIAQPMLQILGDNPVYFAVQGFQAQDVVLYSVALVVLVPAVALGVEVIAGLFHERIAVLVHQLFVVVLAFEILGRALRSLPFTGILALAAAFCAAWVYRHWKPAHEFLTICALAPILFVSLFLVKVPLSALSATEPPAGTMPSVASTTNVVLVIFDEFAPTSLMTENGQIDSIRYPNFAALARSSTWYRNATTVSDATDWAVPAILTGRITRRDQLPVVADHPENIFTLLGRTYDVHAFQAVTRLCPVSICPTASPPLGTRLRRVLSDVKRTSLLRWPDHEGEWATPPEELADFISTIRPTPQPKLAVLHLLLPHEPLAYLPSGRKYEGGDAIDGYAWDRWTRDGRVVDQAYQRYLFQVGYVDRVLGQLVRRLRSADLWNRSLVIVTADHGVSFRPGERRRLVNVNNIPDIAPIPLFVKRPGQVQGAVDERSARSIDIVPTIADVLGIDAPWHLDGRSLFAPGRPRPSKIIVRSYTRDVVKVSWSRVSEERKATIARKVGLFGSGGQSMFAPGRFRSLLGRKVGSYPARHSPTVHAEIQWPTSARFNPQSSFAPSRVTGTIAGASTDQTLKLAVAVNGRIAAVTETLPMGGELRFATFVPESALRSGANVITILAVRGRLGASVALAKIGSTH